MVLEPVSIRYKIPDTEENRKKCHCHLCPSYPHECKGDLLYCGTHASEHDIISRGCICDTCPIYYKYELKGFYYCNMVETGKRSTLMRKQGSCEDNDFYQMVVDIREESIQGESLTVSMGSQKKQPYSLDDLYFIPAQVNRIPLNREEPINSKVTLGKRAEKPFTVASPILISALSFGAVSKNVKLVILETAHELGIGFNSGEGGLMDEEKTRGWNQRILQYSTGRFGLDEDLIKQAKAVEIRFGQGAYPGRGSYLPAEKMTREIARIRGLKHGEGAYSPAHHEDMATPKDIEDKISWLHELTGGAPVGAKIGCGDVKKDVKTLANAGADFITLDGFGGGTGAVDLYIRENVGIPLIAAIPRACEALGEMGLKDEVSIIASGGLRRSADFAKMLALGADAVYIGTAALIAINCQQYRICYTGFCPTGVATQNPQLTKQIDIEDGVNRLSNFIQLSTSEVENLTRVVGKDDVNGLDRDDLISVNKDLREICGVKWLD